MILFIIFCVSELSKVCLDSVKYNEFSSRSCCTSPNSFTDNFLDLSDLEEIREKFKRTQETFSKIFPKVDPQLLLDLLLREQQDPHDALIYTLEVFMKKGTNIEKVRDTILQRTGTIPSIHDGGTHVVSSHKVKLDLLNLYL